MQLRLYQLVEIHEGREGVYINTPRTLTQFLAEWDDRGYADFYGEDYNPPEDGMTQEWLESLTPGDHFIAGDICDDNYMYISVYEITIDYSGSD